VAGSASKAQNVNAALALATGDVVGIFDADHHPHPDAFKRAWRSLSQGYEVVQGHCVIRNGGTSVLTRTVAVESETIYAVSHPGRTRLHGFGLFGGSNGYWRADTLARTRMRGSMLTEDIDSAIRVVRAGGAIATDPGLLSLELAPTSVRDLWNQWMRWSQGWFQVSMRHLGPCLRTPALSLRQKLGMLVLLGWREVYPWLSLQVFPLLAFIYEAGGAGNLDWTVPVLILTAVFTLSVGPGQTLFAWRLAAPELRRERGWFWLYLLIASVAYMEFKNTIARVAQLKELSGQRRWVVTPRSGQAHRPRAGAPG
jgi:cellulose synthase/poly-beta-1,6-N-acetylglucosamine synthase-like glycosyltransferase